MFNGVCSVLVILFLVYVCCVAFVAFHESQHVALNKECGVESYVVFYNFGLAGVTTPINYTELTVDELLCVDAAIKQLDGWYLN